MNKALLLAPIALSCLLAACGEPTTIVSNGPADPTKDEIAKAPPVKLPPALLASKTYRCQPGNAVLFIDWFNDNTSAAIKTKKKEETGTPLTAPAAGQPFTGGGYTVAGSATATSVDVTGPDGKLTCTA